MKVCVEISRTIDKDFSVGITNWTFDIAELLLANRVIYILLTRTYITVK
jgi:hypothetical protein